MCGIVGYIGKRQALPILLDGLKKLEYRGYDSAGVAIIDDKKIIVTKASGKIKALEEKTIDLISNGSIGVAHTRWATHGPPIEKNAHPHLDQSKTIAVVHNGIIENYTELKQALTSTGHTFESDTDTEVLPHLIEEELKTTHSLIEAVRRTLTKLRGTYGIAVISQNHPNELVVARAGSPLVIGIGDNEYIIASDASAIIQHTKQVIYLDDFEIAHITQNTHEISTLTNEQKAKQTVELEWDAEEVQKNGYAHFMLKEIMEQPEVFKNTCRGRIDTINHHIVLGGLKDVSTQLRNIERLIIVGCGSAYYAGLIGEYMIEDLVGLPVEVELASEFRYRNPIINKNTAVLAISQSGETADTLAAIREAKQKGALTLGIINTVGSTIARETNAGIYNHAGPEIGVASTKALLSQVTVLAMFSILLGEQRHIPTGTRTTLINELAKIPEHIQHILNQQESIKKIAEGYKNASNMLYLGRKYMTPIAYEGALKLKEITYIHAEGYAAGEMKHGPIALIDSTFPCLALAPHDAVFEKTKSNLQEIRARGGQIIAITTEGHDELKDLVQDQITIPKTHEALQPLLAIIPLQLFAYHVSVAKGFDPDKPRNLAKSVTVE